MHSLPAITENWLSTTHLCINKEVLTRCFLLAGNDFKAHRGGKMSLPKMKIDEKSLKEPYLINHP